MVCLPEVSPIQEVEACHGGQEIQNEMIVYEVSRVEVHSLQVILGEMHMQLSETHRGRGISWDIRGVINRIRLVLFPIPIQYVES